MKHRYFENVTTLTYDTDKCVGCGRCAEVCPHGVFDLNGNNARIVDRDACMECGACALNYPATAIKVSAGVGCAAAIIMSWFSGKEPSCGCSNSGGGGCCG